MQSERTTEVIHFVVAIIVPMKYRETPPKVVEILQPGPKYLCNRTKLEKKAF